jgi:hypothetical protein
MMQAMASTWRASWMGSAALYWTVVATLVLTWQACFVGTAGVVYPTPPSFHSSVCMAAVLTANVLGGVFVFGAEKGVATWLPTSTEDGPCPHRWRPDQRRNRRRRLKQTGKRTRGWNVEERKGSNMLNGLSRCEWPNGLEIVNVGVGPAYGYVTIRNSSNSKRLHNFNFF